MAGDLINIDTEERQWLPNNLAENGRVIAFSAASKDYGFLSNMFISPMEIGNVRFHSVEQYFQHTKMATSFFHTQAEKILSVPPEKVKSCKALGGKSGRCKMSEEQQRAWYASSLSVMRAGLGAKFEQNDELRRRLLATRAADDLGGGGGGGGRDAILVEKLPRFGDKLWGVNCKGVGQNRLGQLLMELRDRFASASDPDRA